jgi:hypothetical protein
MHPNWKLLATVDFPRKVFVQSTGNSDPAPAEHRAAKKSGSSGEEVRQFYEEVLASGSSVKQEETKTLRPEPRKSTRKKFLRVKSEFLESTELDQSLLRKAFVAAQNNDSVRLSFDLIENFHTFVMVESLKKLFKRIPIVLK